MLFQHSAWLVEAYADAVTPEYGYMVIDNKSKTLETHRFRTGIFIDETPAFYSEKLMVINFYINAFIFILLH